MKGFLLFLFLIIHATVWAQEEASLETIKDAALWLNTKAEFRFSPKVRWDVSQELRLDNNFSSFSSTLTDIGVNYRIFSFLRFSANYRFTLRNNEPRVLGDKRHRWYGDLTLRHTFKFLDMSYRVRWQKEYENIYTGKYGMIPDKYLRQKAGIEFDFGKKIVPWTAAEFFYHLRGLRIYNEFNRIRIYAGTDYKLNTENTFSLFYLLQQDINVAEPEQDNIVGIGYTRSFSLMKKLTE